MSIVVKGYTVTPQMIELVTDWIVGVRLEASGKTVQIRTSMIAEKFGIDHELASAINRAIFTNPPRRLQMVAGKITWRGKA